MTKTLTLTARSEAVEFDHDVLSSLCAVHGAGTETFLTERLMEIGTAMDHAAAELRAGETEKLDRTCADLADLASTIGMRTVTLAARAVRDAIARADATALAACGTRMIRLGHPSGIDAWTVRHGTVA